MGNGRSVFRASGGRTRVTEALQWRKGKTSFVEPKSETSRRTLKLPEFAVAALKKHRTRQKKERLAAKSWADADLVFTTTTGTPVDSANLRREFRQLLVQAQLPPIRLHDLRHTCATLLMAQGVLARVVKETPGHSQITLTLDTYSHVSAELQAQAATTMDELIRPAQPVVVKLRD